MKITVLQAAFFVSLLIHGTVFSAVYAFNHWNATVKVAGAEGSRNKQGVEISFLSEADSAVSECLQKKVELPKPMTVTTLPPQDEKALDTAVETTTTVSVSDKNIPAPHESGTAESAPVTVSVTAKPDYLINPKPIYPSEALRRKQEGKVLLSVLVNADGKPERVEVSQSSGYGLLDSAAVQAVRNWQFSPAKAGGVAIASTVEVPVQFRLKRV